jgi:hypothetical protein
MGMNKSMKTCLVESVLHDLEFSVLDHALNSGRFGWSESVAMFGRYVMFNFVPLSGVQLYFRLHYEIWRMGYSTDNFVGIQVCCINYRMV